MGKSICKSCRDGEHDHWQKIDGSQDCLNVCFEEPEWPSCSCTEAVPDAHCSECGSDSIAAHEWNCCVVLLERLKKFGDALEVIASGRAVPRDASLGMHEYFARGISIGNEYAKNVAKRALEGGWRELKSNTRGDE